MVPITSKALRIVAASCGACCVLLLGGVFSGCGPDTPPVRGAGGLKGVDGGVDAGTELDAGLDAGVNGGTESDAGFDAGADAGPELDAGVDAGLDPDAGSDAGFADPLACAEAVFGSGNPGILGNPMLGEPAPRCGSGTMDYCCPDGGPVTECGPFAFDLSKRSGDSDRSSYAPSDGGGLDVTLRARVSASGVPVDWGMLSCDLDVDSTQGVPPDFRIDFHLYPVSDGGPLVLEAFRVSQEEAADFSFSGNFVCDYGSSTSLVGDGGVNDLDTAAAEAGVRASFCNLCPCQ